MSLNSSAENEEERSGDRRDESEGDDSIDLNSSLPMGCVNLDRNGTSRGCEEPCALAAEAPLSADIP